jgi:hypothetical protein
MYLVYFTKKYLKTFKTSLVKTVKRLAGLAKSTPTDLLIDQGLQNVFTLQACVRAEFMQSALQAVDTPCLITSKINYTYLREEVGGTEPFSNVGRSIEWPKSRFSPLFQEVRAHLNRTDMSLLVLFDSKADPSSKQFRHTLAPTTYEHRSRLLVSKDLSATHANKLFHNLTQAGLHELEDVCPLFEVYLADLQNDPGNAPQEWWEKEKGRITIGAEELIRCRTPEPPRSILHCDLRIPGASRAQICLLKILLRIHIENLLAPFSPTNPNSESETQSHRGMFKKHTLNVTCAYPDGSTTKGCSKAGFDVYFPELEATDDAYKKISPQIPGCQTIARAKGYGVLAALLLTSQETELTIHCDRKPLVDL